MKVLYRISDNGYVKPKFERATKRACLENFLMQWPTDEVTVFVDKVTPETQEFLEFYELTMGLKLIPIAGGSSAGSWRIVQNYALNDFPDSEIVYFVEHDYCHLNGSRQC